MAEGAAFFGTEKIMKFADSDSAVRTRFNLLLWPLRRGLLASEKSLECVKHGDKSQDNNGGNFSNQRLKRIPAYVQLRQHCSAVNMASITAR